MKPLNILLVEDDLSWQLVTQEFLEERVPGVVVTVAHSGNQAIRLLTNAVVFDLVITDFQMPDGTGRDVFNYLVSHCLELPLFFFTSADPGLIETHGRPKTRVIPKTEIALLIEEVCSV